MSGATRHPNFRFFLHNQDFRIVYFVRKKAHFSTTKIWQISLIDQIITKLCSFSDKPHCPSTLGLLKNYLNQSSIRRLLSLLHFTINSKFTKNNSPQWVRNWGKNWIYNNTVNVQRPHFSQGLEMLPNLRSRCLCHMTCVGPTYGCRHSENTGACR